MVSRIDVHRFVDKTKLRTAIDAVQRSTTAPIHVSIARYFWGDVRRTAERAFRKHGLARTAQRNGVLFFVVPSRREFVVIGDVGAHDALGQPVWDAVAALVQQQFSRGNTTDALVLGIEELTRALGEPFPPEILHEPRS
jgi:uncharacterized membrane protein